MEAKKEGNVSYVRTLVALYEACRKLIKSLNVSLDQQELVDLMMMTFSKQADLYLECELASLSTISDQKLVSWKKRSQITERKGSSGDLLASPAQSTPPKNQRKNYADMISLELCLEIKYENQNAVKRATVVSYKEDMFVSLFLFYYQSVTPSELCWNFSGKRMSRRSSLCSSRPWGPATLPQR